MIESSASSSNDDLDCVYTTSENTAVFNSKEWGNAVIRKRHSVAHTFSTEIKISVQIPDDENYRLMNSNLPKIAEDTEISSCKGISINCKQQRKLEHPAIIQIKAQMSPLISQNMCSDKEQPKSGQIVPRAKKQAAGVIFEWSKGLERLNTKEDESTDESDASLTPSPVLSFEKVVPKMMLIKEATNSLLARRQNRSASISPFQSRNKERKEETQKLDIRDVANNKAYGTKKDETISY